MIENAPALSPFAALVPQDLMWWFFGAVALVLAAFYVAARK